MHNDLDNDLFLGQSVERDYGLFFTNRFRAALDWYYQDKTPNDRTILSASGNLTQIPRLLDVYLPEERDRRFFSTAVFFVCLIPQVIARVAGKAAKQAFHEASGWPEMSAGMGGWVSPGQWLKESRLAPDVSEARDFNGLLDEVLPFHLCEMAALWDGDRRVFNKKAYDTLCAALNGKRESFREELLSAVSQAETEFLEGDIKVYYLTEEERYY